MRRSLELCGVGITACLVAATFGGCAAEDTPGGEAGSGGSSSGRGGNGAAGSSGAPGKGGAGGSSAAAGTGGTGGSAGTGGSGGSAGIGGTPSTGGSAATGGSAGTGGTSTGGSAGAAGATVTGGAAGLGGTSSTGGSAGMGAGAGSGGASGGAAGSAGASGGAGSGGGGSNCPPATPRTGGTRVCSNQRSNAGAGYTYELWAEGSGTGCMNVYGVDATFSANWSGVDDFLARIGLNFDRTRTPAEVGTITAEFAHTKTGSEEGLTYIGIYGWTVNPLREYYILDDWGTTKPAGVASDGSPRTNMGTIDADGETYDVWMKTRENKPAITGDNMTFDQYFSIRRTPRQCGTISVSEHFSRWIELGLPLGDLVEVTLLLEAQFNAGSAEFTTAKILVD